MNATVPESGDLILVRIEGKLDRMNDRMERYERDHQGLRARVHDLANEISPIVMLDLPGRIRTSDQRHAELNARIGALENIEQQRKGAAALIRIIWAIAGATGVAGVAAVLRVFQTGGI